MNDELEVRQEISAEHNSSAAYALWDVSVPPHVTQ